MNGDHRPDREAERMIEFLLFADLPDYHRSIERMIIDPPLAAIAWDHGRSFWIHSDQQG